MATMSPGRHQRARDDVEGLLRARQHDDARGVAGDRPRERDVPGDRRAQPLDAGGREGVVRASGEVPEHPARQPAPDVERERLLIAEPELQVHRRAGASDRADPDLVGLRRPPQARVGRRVLRIGARAREAGLAGHEGPGAVLGLDQPLGDEHVVDGCDGVARDAEAGRHPASRRQPHAGPQPPRGDRVPKLLVQRSEQPARGPVGQVDGKLEQGLRSCVAHR